MTSVLGQLLFALHKDYHPFRDESEILSVQFIEDYWEIHLKLSPIELHKAKLRRITL